MNITDSPFELGEDQLRIRDLVRRVADERVAPRAAEIDATGDYPQDMFDLLKELGLFTLHFPKRSAAQTACCRPA